MVEVGGHPLLWHILKRYSHFGFSDFTLCLGYKGDVIRRFFLQYTAVRHDFTIDLADNPVVSNDRTHPESDWRVRLVETGLDTMTGGRLKRIKSTIRGETFLMTYGDGVADIDVGRLVAFHRQEGRIATVTAVKPPARFGALQLDCNQVVRFDEKNPDHEPWVSGGFFVFQREVFDLLEGDDCVLETDALPKLASSNELAAYRHRGYWHAVDTLSDVEELRSQWASGERSWAVWEESP
jgi:glucose-1-phosphate cytidylyltransferase